MSETIDLKGLNKGGVLAALYNAAKPLGMGFMQYDPTPMTVEEAEMLLERGTYFDYLKGRVMKVELGGDTLNTWGYDRDNGQGAAAAAIASLQKTSDPANSEIQHTHSVNTVRSAQQVQSKLGEKTEITNEGGIPVVDLGFSDEKNILAPKVAKAKYQNKNK